MDKLRELITKYGLQEGINSRDNVRVLDNYINSLLNIIDAKEVDIANKELELNNIINQSTSNS